MKIYLNYLLTIWFFILIFFSEKGICKGLEQKSGKDTTAFPKEMQIVVKPYYRYHGDGKAGREMELKFEGGCINNKSSVELIKDGKIIQKTEIKKTKNCIKQISLLLPPDIGVNEESKLEIKLVSGKNIIQQSVVVSALRQWTVYIYPHSHVDIGYSNTQANVEIIHKRNLLHGIRIAEETKNNPEGSRYVWSPEVLWPLERYLKNASNRQAEEMLEGVRKGYIALDANYVHVNTSACSDEEMFRLFDTKRQIEKKTGKEINTFVQVDIPGISWGMVPVLNHEGIKYVYHLYNGGARVGMATGLSARPFWWVGPDGKSKVLFFQPNNDGYLQYSYNKGFSTGRPWLGQIDPEKIPETIKTDTPRKYFLGDSLFKKLGELQKAEYYPYDIFPISWSLWDNTPLDEDLPAAVKSWNEEYAYPRLKIASVTEIMTAFDKRYGDKLPVYRGDLTEYWTDGLGTVAELTAKNLSSKERLTQSQALWTMLNSTISAPVAFIDEAWRNAILGTEHTFVYERMGIGKGLGAASWAADKTPADKFFRESIFNVKKGYFQEAENLSHALLKWSLTSVPDTTSSHITVFNTLSQSRSGLIILTAGQSKAGDVVNDITGKTIPSQRLSTGELAFVAEDVPAFSSKTYSIKKGMPAIPEMPCSINETKAYNGLLTVEIDSKTGNIVSLQQSGNEIEFADNEKSPHTADHSPQKNGTGLNFFRQLPGGSDKANADENIQISITEKGPLLVEWQVKSYAPGCNSVMRKIRLVSGLPWIEFENIIDKQIVYEKEGIHIGFSFNIPDPVIRVDIPWGVMRVEADQMPEANRNWLVKQRWLDISNDNYGVTFVSHDAPLFEAGEMTANIMRNGPGWRKHITPTSTIYSWVLNNHWYTNFPLAQEGLLKFRYSILPHSEGYEGGKANLFGLSQKQPLIVTTGKMMIDKPVVELTGSSAVFVSILKPGEDGRSAIVYLRSVSEKEETVALSSVLQQTVRMYVCHRSEEPASEASEKIKIPALGMAVLKAVW